MPPHGHHHHGGGGRRGAGNVFVNGWGPAYGPSWDPTPDYQLVTIDTSDPEWQQRAMAQVMATPKPGRLAAYRRLFGKEPPPHALDGLFDTVTNPWFIILALGAWWYFTKSKAAKDRRWSRSSEGRAWEHDMASKHRRRQYDAAVKRDRARYR
jgi:hypothetical protein